MAALFQSGTIVDLIVALMAIEVLALSIHHRASGRGIGFLRLLPNLLAGIFLLAALRAALRHQDWRWIGLCLFAALIAHLFDIGSRWSAKPDR